jgi:hypothetical protein
MVLAEVRRGKERACPDPRHGCPRNLSVAQDRRLSLQVRLADPVDVSS